MGHGGGDGKPVHVLSGVLPEQLQAAPARVEPLDFWWGPFGWDVAAAYALIVVGGLTIGILTALGYTVVDASTVVATHLSQLIQDHAHELLGHEEVQQLLDILAKSAPKLVEDLVPNRLSIGLVLRVLQNLLE